VLGWLTTTDHKRIGLLYFWATLVFFGAGGVEALLLRTQLARANEHVLGPNMYDQLFTTHGLTMIFWFIIPMTTGAFGNYLIPLMIGARDMAFPRLNALSFWVFLASGIFVYVGLFLGFGLAGFEPGDYTLVLHIADEVRGESREVNEAFTIVSAQG